MTDYAALGFSLAAQDVARPMRAYARFAAALKGGSASTISDLELVAAAQYAVRNRYELTAIEALNELALRLASDEPIESIQRAA